MHVPRGTSCGPSATGFTATDVVRTHDTRCHQRTAPHTGTGSLAATQHPPMTTCAQAAASNAQLDGASACCDGERLRTDSSETTATSWPRQAAVYELCSITCSPASSCMSPIPEESGELTSEGLSGYELGGGLPAWCESDSAMRQPQASKWLPAQVIPTDISESPESLHTRSTELSGPSYQVITPLITPLSEQPAAATSPPAAAVVVAHHTPQEVEERALERTGTPVAHEREWLWRDVAWESGPALLGCMLPFAACVTLWLW